MELAQQILHAVLHLDEFIQGLVKELGPWSYVLLFVVVFCETGLVVTPFLPGDSLLFAVGALAAGTDTTLSLPILAVVLIAAAVLGDAVNYQIGSRIGPRIFSSEKSWLFNKKHLLRTQAFYEKYGAKTIVLARFVPIVRTFAPFVAGIGRMSYGKFFAYNVAGGVTWVLLFLFAGYWFGTWPLVKANFDLVILAIVFISLLPPLAEFVLARRRRAAEAAVPVEAK
jgi:membrane-associated protein